MKRPARFILNVATLLSATLAVIAASLWVRSEFVTDEWTCDWGRYVEPSELHLFERSYWLIRSGHGGFVFHHEWSDPFVALAYLPYSTELRTSAPPVPTPPPTAATRRRRWIGPIVWKAPSPLDWSSGITAEFIGEPLGLEEVRGILVTGGYVWPFGLAALLPTMRVVQWATRQCRLRAARFVGKCRTCHYDLTGNVSGVCPECGTAVQSDG